MDYYESGSSESEDSEKLNSLLSFAELMSGEESNNEEDESDREDEEDHQIRLDLQTKLLPTLEKLNTPSAFAYSAIDELLPNPGLCLPHHGVVSLPLSTDDAQKIISQASQSSFGRGEEAMIDTSVYKNWELDPNQFSLKNPAWNKAIETVADRVCTGLGLDKGTGKVSAELCKLLLYEPGAFLTPHKGTEKAPKVFATLIVCLPSPHEGGKLVMTLDDEMSELETAGSSDFSFSYAAWYSDITHEVLPVTSGYCLMLTYNLIRSNFVIPSYNSVREHVKQLSTLLEEYELALKGNDNELPPFLLHKLKHEYPKADLKLNVLKPQDLAQVSTLWQLSAKLGFDIYLATLMLAVKKEDEFDDYNEGIKFQSLKNIVELDGKLIMKSLDIPEEALIDPKPQDAGTRPPDKIQHGYWSRDELGGPITYCYYDTVVVLVPPSKREDFVFGFSYVRDEIIGPLFCKLIEEYSKDPAKKWKIEQLCARVLRQHTLQYSWYKHQLSDSIPSYFQKALNTAFDLDRIDLFDVACRTSEDKIIPSNAHMLGYWAAKNGFSAMRDRLMRGIRIAPSVAKKQEFLVSIFESFEAAVQELASTENVDLKQWSNEAFLTAVAEQRILTKADGVTLAQLCKTMAWSLFKLKITPVIKNTFTMVKIAFIEELLLNPQQELIEEQQSFIKMIIHNVWNKIFYYHHDISEKDVHHIAETTIKILSSESVETIIIPAMLTAIPDVTQICTEKLFILLVRMIIGNKLLGFRLADDAVPPSSHKRLVQALLTKFLLANVRLKPPKNWSLPVRSCNCHDCAVVNRFLQDPVRKTLNFPCQKLQRMHLYKIFTHDSRERNCKTLTYDVATIRRRDLNIWRITKHRRGCLRKEAEWMKETEYATQTLSELKNDEAVDGRLEAYLQPYYSIIMAANVIELPDLESLVATPQLSETSENVAPNLPTNQTGHKREASKIDLPEDELVKRTK